MRYGYFAFEHRKTSINDVYLEAVGFAEVNPVLGKHATYIEGLKDWALDLLRNGKHESGLFSFSYGEITNRDEPGDDLAHVFLAWDGQRELTAAQLSVKATITAS
jgi:hypothetical protein